MDPHRTERLRRMGGALVLLLSVATGLAALLPILPWFIWFGMSAIAAVTVGWVTWRTTRPVQLPADLMKMTKAEDRNVLVTPVERQLIPVLNQHARSVFGNESMTAQEYMDWWETNPRITAALMSSHGDYLGYFDLLPLTDEAAQLLTAGQSTEANIRGQDILGPSAMKRAETLYLAGIAAKDCGTDEGKRRAAQLIGGMAGYVRLFYGNRKRRVIAIAATAPGEHLLRDMGAKIVGLAAGRLDGHNLYEFFISERFLKDTELRAAGRGPLAAFSYRSSSP